MYDLRNSLTDEKLAGNFEPADKKKLGTAVDNTISWISLSQEVSGEDYKEHRKELEAAANPIKQKLYQFTGSQPGGFLDDAPSYFCGEAVGSEGPRHRGLRQSV